MTGLQHDNSMVIGHWEGMHAPISVLSFLFQSTDHYIVRNSGEFHIFLHLLYMLSLFPFIDLCSPNPAIFATPWTWTQVSITLGWHARTEHYFPKPSFCLSRSCGTGNNWAPINYSWILQTRQHLQSDLHNWWKSKPSSLPSNKTMDIWTCLRDRFN